MKIIIDLNFELTDLANNVLGLASKTVAGLLMSELRGDAVKLFDWATELNTSGKITVDEADLNVFKEIIKSTERMSVIVKGPIMKHLNTLK